MYDLIDKKMTTFRLLHKIYPSEDITNCQIREKKKITFYIFKTLRISDYFSNSMQKFKVVLFFLRAHIYDHK